ncbi:MAG TPA: Zn-dependent hydrolase [Ruminococcaceae bacterium]|nr:Zn-dependent hydrolase [Oscillospiraceae bacterium]
MQTCNQDRLQNKITAFSHFGATPKGGITRLSLSKSALEARAEFCNRCKKLGMDIKTDDMGNIYATIKGTENLPAISMGSHIDSVVQGGNYDGILGVLTALEAAETIITEKIKTRHPITVIIWTNEEGARFDPAMMSSGVITGKFNRDDMMKVKDIKGISFGEALEASGYLGSASNRLSPSKQAAYLELHIEQGPVLEAEHKNIGILEGVVGMVNYEIHTVGQSDHAGTTPMKMRQDALHAASILICDLYDKLSKIDNELVFTFGRIISSPNVHTVIPDDVRFTLDARHKDPAIVQKVVDVIKNLPTEVVKCQVSSKELWARKTVNFHVPFVDIVEKNVNALGYTGKRMYSGPGHDAQFVADVLPTTMIFVPSIDGHSHCEEEKTDIADCYKGANVLLNTVLDIDKAI